MELHWQTYGGPSSSLLWPASQGNGWILTHGMALNTDHLVHQPRYNRQEANPQHLLSALQVSKNSMSPVVHQRTLLGIVNACRMMRNTSVRSLNFSYCGKYKKNDVKPLEKRWGRWVSCPCVVLHPPELAAAIRTLSISWKPSQTLTNSK